MTPTKIKRKLIELCDKLGSQTECYIFHDKWADDEPVRETVTLGEVIKYYDEKTSGYYKLLSITSNYLDFEKNISKHSPFHIRQFYEDSYNAYMKAWSEKHPGEDYDEWCKQQHRKTFNEVYNLYNRYMHVPGIDKVFYY